jgi:DNA-binding winged helix-turn-helix (wHTH) protein
MIKEGKHFYEFGPYRIDPEERLLLRGRELIRLPPKAFETLLILVNQSEKVVLKDDLMKSLWPNTFVEEANLSQNIFVLRKALGETAQDARYITTVAGRGYRFAQKVARVADDESIQIESQTIRSVTVEEEGVAPTSEAAPGHPGRSRRLWPWVLTGAAVLAAVAITAVIVLHRSTKPPMNEADLVLPTL